MKRALAALKKYFIPHEENGHKPHILRVQSVAFVLIIALVVESVFLYGSSMLAPRSRLFGVILTNALVDETNQNRVANGLSPLTVDPLLQAAAQDKADDMVANNYFAHTSPTGLTPWYWFEKVGYGFTYAGENLAVNFSDSQDVTNAWMNSPEHRANILNGDFTNIGMATAQGTFEGKPAVYVVELFGTPTPPAPPADAIPFISSAAAADTPVAAQANAPRASVATAATPTKQKSSGNTLPKNPVKSSSALIVIATSALQTTGSNETFVAVKGVSTQAANASAASPSNVLGLQTTTIAVGTIANSGFEKIQSNPIQQAASDPRQIVDYIYLALILLFGLALALNVFIKIRIQHPQVILGGMMVILVAGLFIVLNQHILASAAIL
jgi:hypothetical protein